MGWGWARAGAVAGEGWRQAWIRDKDWGCARTGSSLGLGEGWGGLEAGWGWGGRGLGRTGAGRAAAGDGLGGLTGDGLAKSPCLALDALKPLGLNLGCLDAPVLTFAFAPPWFLLCLWFAFVQPQAYLALGIGWLPEAMGTPCKV